jgi:serine/threonine-protein kinase
MTPTVQSFLTTLRKSNLLTPEQVAVANGLSQSKDAISIAKDLIQREWLTEWQARQLLAGKSKLFLGKYKLLDVLGRGGMGAVLKAESMTLRRHVALKVMATDLLKNDVARARFEREIQFVATLNHPNIVRAIDADRVGERFFLVMEYVDGRDLKSLIKQHNQVPIEFACECIRQAALGLQHAHEHGVVHRDIKPSNLLISKHPETQKPLIQVLDLGLARIEQDGSISDSHHTTPVLKNSENDDDGSITHSGQIMGSPDYMPPEQATDSRNADIRSDIYGLGCTLFHLISGHLPYSGDNVMEKLVRRINQDAPPISKFRPDVPPVLVHIIARMINRDPAQRFQTPAEVAAVLEAFVANPNAQPVQTEQQLLMTPSRDIPTAVLPEADDTLNFFGGHLESRVTARPMVRRRKKNKHWPLITSIVTASVLLATVLFALSRNDGVAKDQSGTNKGSKKSTASKNSGDKKSTGLKNLLATDDDKSAVPLSNFDNPDRKVAHWAIRFANSVTIRVNGKSKQLADVSDIPKTDFIVVSIDLSGTQNLRTRDLDMLAAGAGLRTLSLNGADIGDIHLQHVAKLSRLSSLDLSKTALTDRGVAQLESLSSLTTLQLSYTAVGDEGMKSLSKLTQIATLNLTGSNITDTAIDTLCELDSLTKLGIRHTKISPAGYARLKEKLPDCEITF